MQLRCWALMLIGEGFSTNPPHVRGVRAMAQLDHVGCRSLLSAVFEANESFLQSKERA